MESSEDAPLRDFGFDRGLITVSDDFDDPLPDELLEAFEGTELRK